MLHPAHFAFRGRPAAPAVILFALAAAATSPATAQTSPVVKVRPAAAALSSCSPSDNGDPDLSSLRFEPSVVDVRRHAQTRVTVVLKYVPDWNVAVQYHVFYDTSASRPGPEYRFDVIPNAEGAALRRWVGGWSGHPGSKVSCRMRITADAFDGKPIRVSLPRSCLGNPGRVRAAAQSIMGFPSSGQAPAQPADWAPQRHAFYPWVARGGA